MIIHDLPVVNGREKGVQSNIKRLTSMNSNGLSKKMGSVFVVFCRCVMCLMCFKVWHSHLWIGQRQGSPSPQTKPHRSGSNLSPLIPSLLNHHVQTFSHILDGYIWVKLIISKNMQKQYPQLQWVSNGKTKHKHQVSAPCNTDLPIRLEQPFWFDRANCYPTTW